MSEAAAFYLSIAAVAVFLVGGIHLLGYLMRSKTRGDDHHQHPH